jgi:putative ABC transport system ATP-binding protein
MSASIDTASHVSTAHAPAPAALLEDVWCVYPGTPPVNAVAAVTLTIDAGELVAVIGPSGSGKSTLVHVLCGLEVPTAGSVHIAGEPIRSLNDEELSRLRAERIGVVFQRFFLIDSLTALDTVAMGLLYRGIAGPTRRALAKTALERVGLGHRLDHRPRSLSGGEQQRVAIARAVVGGPSLLIADEPTGNLDRAAGDEVMRLLLELRDEGSTLVVVTHDEQIARRAARQIELLDGRVVRDSRSGRR